MPRCAGAEQKSRGNDFTFFIQQSKIINQQ